MIAGLEPVDAGPNLLDDSGPLVATDDRQRHGHVPGDQVLVGVAHPRRGKADEQFALLGGIELDGLDTPIAVAFPQDGGFGLHGFLPKVSCALAVLP